MIAVPITTEGAFDVGKSIPLFQKTLSIPVNPALTFPYDVSPDGQRFLFSVPVSSELESTLTVTVNWMSALKR